MNEKKLYVCNILFRRVTVGGIHDFVTPAIASDRSAALLFARSQLEANFPGEVMLIVLEDCAPVNNEIVEQAAIEVLGWSKPE